MRRLLSLVVPLVFAAVPLELNAQMGGVDWEDIDCQQSRIGPTEGLRCRATRALTTDMHSTGQGDYRFWSAFGTINGVNYYYYLAEVLNAKSAIVVRQELSDAIRIRSPQGKDGTDISRVTKREGVDFVSFRSAQKTSCVGLVRMGPPQANGVKWVLYATRCTAPDQADADIATFIQRATVRQ
jgi:hypothetical protein